MSEVSWIEPETFSFELKSEVKSLLETDACETEDFLSSPKRESDCEKDAWNLFAAWRRFVFSSRSSSRLAKENQDMPDKRNFYESK